MDYQSANAADPPSPKANDLPGEWPVSLRPEAPFARAFDHCEDPVVLIDGTARVLFQNTAAKVVLRSGKVALLRGGKLTLNSAAGQKRFNRLLLEFHTGEQSVRSGAALRLNEARGKDWLVLIYPLADSQRSGASFVVQLIRRLAVRRTPYEVFMDLFDLTPRELQVVSLLANGFELRAIATQLRLSHESIRIYLKRVFRKCDVHSQSELNLLVHRLAMFAPPTAPLYPSGNIGSLLRDATLRRT